MQVQQQRAMYGGANDPIEAQMQSLETEQCELMQQLHQNNKLQHILMLVMFVGILMFIISIYLDATTGQPYQRSKTGSDCGGSWWSC